MSEKIPKGENGGGNLPSLKNFLVPVLVPFLLNTNPATATESSGVYPQSNNQNLVEQPQIVSIGPDKNEIPKAPPLEVPSITPPPLEVPSITPPPRNYTPQVLPQNKTSGYENPEYKKCMSNASNPKEQNECFSDNLDRLFNSPEN